MAGRDGAGGAMAGGKACSASAEVADTNAEERGNIRTMLRWVGAFLAWPGLSIALVFLLDLEDHVGHFAISLTAGIAGIVVFARAGRIAARFYPPPDDAASAGP